MGITFDMDDLFDPVPASAAAANNNNVVNHHHAYNDRDSRFAAELNLGGFSDDEEDLGDI
jgi:hypothetical protein